jgi:putative transcriptional regulator
VSEVPTFRGKLLVASPPLVDPNFDRTVVLMLEHNDEGALGVVLNRPSGTPLDDILPEWRAAASEPDVLFVGGPVSPEAVIALARGSGGSRDGDGDREGWAPLFADLASVDVGRDPLDLGVPLDALRVFAGYAGWSPGQLEGEIEQGGWFVVDRDRDDPFTLQPGRLWGDVLRRQRGRVAMFANYPEDASAN